MAACTDLPFRLIAREKGLGFSFLEMVSAQALSRRNAKTFELLKSAPADRPLGAQLLGCEPGVMAESARIIEDMGFDLLDLNLGCPVRKVVTNGEGAALLKDPRRAAEVFRAVKGATRRIPVTVKMRKGFEDESGREAVEIARAAEGEGLCAVTVHGRTQKQGYSGRADYSAIGRVKTAVSIPVIGNGDVLSAEDARRMRRESGCDGVMIGRGGLGNPWIYRALDAALEGSDEAIPLPSPQERLETMLKHLDLEVEHLGPRQACLNMRRITVWYTAGLPECKPFRAEVCRTENTERIRGLILDFWARLPQDLPEPQAPVLLSE